MHNGVGKETNGWYKITNVRTVPHEHTKDILWPHCRLEISNCASLTKFAHAYHQFRHEPNLQLRLNPQSQEGSDPTQSPG